MTNLHYIADEQLGGVEREYAEVERKANVGDYVVIVKPWATSGKYGKGAIFKAERRFGHGIINGKAATHEGNYNPEGFIGDEEYATLDPTGNVRIDGTVYRMVERNADVEEKVLAIKECVTYGFEVGDVFTATDSWSISGGIDVKNSERDSIEMYGDEYVVLEPAEDLTLTEADVRNNPRQVIDLIANLALRVTTLEKGADRLSKLESKVDRLGTANQKAYDIVARNVETWAQEFEEYKQSPAPWATQEQLVELTKQVAEIAGRKQPKDSAVEISELTAKSALLIAEAKVILERIALTAEERREL